MNQCINRNFKTNCENENYHQTTDISIKRSTVIHKTKLLWMNYDNVPSEMMITNSGSTLTLSAKWLSEWPYITNGPLNSKYIIKEINSHWGKTALEGSYHTIDGIHYPFELHAIHIKKEYVTLKRALLKNDGICIVAYLFDVNFTKNLALEKFLRYINEIRESERSTLIKPFKISELFGTFEIDYYSYRNKIIIDKNICEVLWIIPRKFLTISFDQLYLFRKLMNSRLRSITHDKCNKLDKIYKGNSFLYSPMGNLRSTMPIIAQTLSEVESSIVSK